MSPEQQRIAIAEFCGWEVHHGGRYCSIPNSENPMIQGKLLDPLNDLNAINQAEMMLNNESGLNLIETLCAVRGGWEHNTRFDLFVKSTAAQRAEALLRTIGRWADHKSPPSPHSTVDK